MTCTQLILQQRSPKFSQISKTFNTLLTNIFTRFLNQEVCKNHTKTLQYMPVSKLKPKLDFTLIICQNVTITRPTLITFLTHKMTKITLNKNIHVTCGLSILYVYMHAQSPQYLYVNIQLEIVITMMANQHHVYSSLECTNIYIYIYIYIYIHTHNVYM